MTTLSPEPLAGADAGSGEPASAPSNTAPSIAGELADDLRRIAATVDLCAADERTLMLAARFLEEAHTVNELHEQQAALLRGLDQLGGLASGFLDSPAGKTLGKLLGT